MRRKTNKFLTCFSKNGKVTELCYCCDNEEVATMGVVARSKGCDIEVFSLRDDEIPVMVEIPNVVESATKTMWKKAVICVETGETFTSIWECSKKQGISYKSLHNALNSGNPRNGKHFVYMKHNSQPKDSSKKAAYLHRRATSAI